MTTSTAPPSSCEGVESSYGYPKGYRVKGIIEQTNILRRWFPSIGYANEDLATKPLPAGAEGWFAIPRWGKVAATYNDAVETVLILIAAQQAFFNNYTNRRGKLSERYLRQTNREIVMWRKLGRAQAGYDILIVPAQFGLWHRGHSVCRAREVMSVSEFGLGAFAAGCMLLTHPKRLVAYDNLFIDCAGDECDSYALGKLDEAPSFAFSGSRVRFNAHRSDVPRGQYGSASGFLSQ